MKRILLILTFCFSEFISFSQTGIDNLWLFGINGSHPDDGTGTIDFISGTPVVYPTSRSVNLRLTDGLISDTLGNLLFYSNGCCVSNSLNDTMFNGDSLNPSDCTTDHCLYGSTIIDGNIVIPDPGNNQRYYLFHETCDYSILVNSLYHPSKLYYSIIDMEEQGGLGAIVEKNVVIVDPGGAIGLDVGFLTSTRHANGRDWWVVCHGLHNNLFYLLLVTPSGVQGPITQSIGPSGLNDGMGTTVFSPDGSKLVTNNWWSEIDSGFAVPEIHIFDFDRCTGQFSNHKTDRFHVNPPNYYGGSVAVSSNSRYLYLSGGTVSLVQYDLYSTNLDSSSRVQIVSDTIGLLWGRLAYDHKIYILGPTVYEFSSINYPDSAGAACQFQYNSIPLPFINGGWTIPNYPNYRLGKLIGSACDTITGIDKENISQVKLNVYPNPSSEGLFHFQFNDIREQIKEIEITDITGRVIKILRKNVHEVDLSNASSGVYFYRIKTNSEKLFNGKLVKQ